MTISINPLGGLCNRMRALDSALALAEAANLPLRLRWELSEDLNCSFDALFSTVAMIGDMDEVRSFGHRGRFLRRLDEQVQRLRGRRVMTQAMVVSRAGDKGFWLEQAGQARPHCPLHIATHSRFFHGRAPFAQLRPAFDIAAEIESYRSRLSCSVGVHIRRTDNVQSMANSPLDCFIALMRSAIRADASIKFFVASDDPAVLRELQENFGDTIWWHAKQAYDRSDPAAIREAMVDLFCLASCRRLIGSYWSSFTDTAAELYGIDCSIAKAGSDIQYEGNTGT